jgi:hypothetical protein
MAKGKSKEKSILDKFTDTMKGLAESASQALKSEEPARVEESAAAYMPFAAEGMVSDLLPVPPMATQPVRRKRAPSEKGKRRAAKRSRKTAAAKPARKAAAKSARAAAARKSARKTSRKTLKRRGAKRVVARKRADESKVNAHEIMISDDC